MRNKHKCHRAFGLGQIMAMLLVVLPAIVFIITFMIDYWRVMQADYKLKLIANQVSERADGMEDLSNFTFDDNVTCPDRKSLVFSKQQDAAKEGQINITITYTHDGPYLKNKVLSTDMHTYSYHDQNMSIIGTCQ